MTTTAAPSVDPRVIGLAHYAGRAVLEHVLGRHGATFQQQITLRLVVTAETPLERDALAAQVTASLKIPETEVLAVVDGLIGQGLAAAEGTAVRATDAGRKLYATVSAETGPISARIYAGIPAEDLAVAGRVLTVITERADAELAALEATRK
ncbi:MarR family transcriptional regulator [Streptomyces sp. NPDC006458]|uniref:MarR family transcriptional regulator n=1 Tax=Streptomyces sp. NPDC006458 TaxID=3154302 RepID=UPI0033B2B9F8